jgi:hypothetical protein
MKIALRSVGFILAVLGLALILLHLFNIVAGSESASLVAGGAILAGGLAPDAIERRARLLGSVGVAAGTLTLASGMGLVLLRRWALWLSLVPVGLVLVFPVFSRIALGPPFRFARALIFRISQKPP